MNKQVVLFLGVAIGIVGSLAVNNLLGAIDRGKAKRNVADTISMTEQLEHYRSEHSSYPIGCDATTLKTQFRSANVNAGSGESWYRYCSDGQQYVLTFVPNGGGEFSRLLGAPVVAANGRLVSWAPMGSRRENLRPRSAVRQ